MRVCCDDAVIASSGIVFILSETPNATGSCLHLNGPNRKINVQIFLSLREEAKRKVLIWNP